MRAFPGTIEAMAYDGWPYHLREILNDRGRPLVVVAACLEQMGATAAAFRATRLVDEVDPVCLAMCGICAGKRGDVFLGDVIVADRVYHYDHGKLIARDEGQVDDFFHDIETYNLEKVWKTDAASFAKNLDWSAQLVTTRPPSKEAQERWLVHTLYAHCFENGPPPFDHPEGKLRCPDWTGRVTALEEKGILTIDDDGLKLTDAGCKRVRRERQIYRDGLPKDPDFASISAPSRQGAPFRRMPSFSTVSNDISARFSVWRWKPQRSATSRSAPSGARSSSRPSRITVIGTRTTGFGNLPAAPRRSGCSRSFRRTLDPRAIVRPPVLDAAERRSQKQELFEDRPGADGRMARRNELLSRVETVFRLREPGAEIIHRPAPYPFTEFLEVAVRDGRHIRISPVAALDGPLHEEAFSMFLTEIDAPYRLHTPWVVSTLVHTGASTPAELERRVPGGVRVATFAEMQGLIEFTGYLEQQTARLARDPRYPPELYVEQRAEILTGSEIKPVDHALEALDKLLRVSYPRFVLILGDFGTGKTFLLHELARRMALGKHPPIPVLVEMHKLVRVGSLNALLAQHLAEAGMTRIETEAFRYMLAEGQIALLFDGFDELAFRVTYDRAAEHFDTLIQAAQGNAKVVITSRTQHFVSTHQVRTALGERADRLPGHRVVTLQPFDQDQIYRFLVNRLGSEIEAERRLQLLKDVRDLLGLSANPRMLSFIADLKEDQLLETQKRDGEITAAALYRLLLERWIVHEFDRAHPKGAPPGLDTKQRWRAVTELANRLWQSTDRAIDIRELPPEIGRAVQAVGPGELDPETMKHLIGSGTLLVRDDDGRFSFIHQSVLEWLVAESAAGEVKRTGEAAALGRREMSDLMADFFIALVEPANARMWAAAKTAAPEHDAAKKNALRVQRRLRERSTEDEEVLELEAEWDLEGEDLRGQDFSNADLRGANLRKANLSNALLARPYEMTAIGILDALVPRLREAQDMLVPLTPFLVHGHRRNELQIVDVEAQDSKDSPEPGQIRVNDALEVGDSPKTPVLHLLGRQELHPDKDIDRGDDLPLREDLSDGTDNPRVERIFLVIPDGNGLHGRACTAAGR